MPFSSKTNNSIVRNVRIFFSFPEACGKLSSAKALFASVDPAGCIGRVVDRTIVTGMAVVIAVVAVDLFVVSTNAVDMVMTVPTFVGSVVVVDSVLDLMAVKSAARVVGMVMGMSCVGWLVMVVEVFCVVALVVVVEVLVAVGV
jgi:hypothetical protein